MKIEYQDAMDALASMFEGIDRETIHEILVSNSKLINKFVISIDGKIEPSIQQLLILSGNEEV